MLLDSPSPGSRPEEPERGEGGVRDGCTVLTGAAAGVLVRTMLWGALSREP